MTIVSQHIWKVIRFCMNFSQIFAGISLIEFNLMQFCFASTRIRSGYITQELTFCRKSEMPTKLNILRLFLYPRQLPRIYLIIAIQNTSSTLTTFRADSTTGHSHQSFHLRQCETILIVYFHSTFYFSSIHRKYCKIHILIVFKSRISCRIFQISQYRHRFRLRHSRKILIRIPPVGIRFLGRFLFNHIIQQRRSHDCDIRIFLLHGCICDVDKSQIFCRSHNSRIINPQCIGTVAACHFNIYCSRFIRKVEYDSLNRSARH